MRRARGGAGRPVVEINESEDLDDTIEQLVLDALDAHPEIGAVYSIAGGNVATLRAFAQKGRRCRVFIATTSTRTTVRCWRPQGVRCAAPRSACRCEPGWTHAHSGPGWTVRDYPRDVDDSGDHPAQHALKVSLGPVRRVSAGVS